MKPGVYPAAVTPFGTKGEIDYPAVARLLSWFKAGGTTGVVLAGTNGEGPSLSALEKRDFVKAAVSLSDGLDIILGVSTPSLDEAKWLCKQTHNAGGTAVLLMPPGYFRDASEEGIAKWFESVLDSSPSPILIYNFPKRTGFTLSPELMARLARHERMIGLKDSSGNRENVATYAQALAGTGKLMFVGDETLLIETLKHGWSGTISGSANVIPVWLSQIVSEWTTNPESAETKFSLIMPALEAIRSSPQPGANKRLLAELGVLPSFDVRLPLESPTIERVQVALDIVRRLNK